MHERTHSFWLPLTTAVIVRPEYASVFVRTVNRIFGTLIGALLTTAFLAVWPCGLPVVAATALALGFVVLSAPKLYGLSVVGITSAALLSQSIGQADPNAPAIRLVDTLIGAAVAVVFGYLLWPGPGGYPDPPGSRRRWRRPAVISPRRSSRPVGAAAGNRPAMRRIGWPTRCVPARRPPCWNHHRSVHLRHRPSRPPWNWRT
ncbi:fusaric acid resistance -like family protein [Mycobacterium kansasii 824]|uniref:Fusaric acid resistance-like family protein n=1 Tax=Mycobacterium kansasii TaxID=1768 RepID=A0A1V3WIF4_MYCKA|nr:fusaric acid resistance -like family protein [Mycobacterium kansasii 824]OOK66749.1 fusaric acid resistance -like family protein [Mycobacterium kansasii]OOK76835.1 fusaric acid resistance -like family protein [Mycobacterium kansasii]